MGAKTKALPLPPLEFEKRGKLFRMFSGAKKRVFQSNSDDYCIINVGSLWTANFSVRLGKQVLTCAFSEHRTRPAAEKSCRKHRATASAHKP